MNRSLLSSFSAGALVLFGAFSPAEPAEFIRGDANSDGKVTISDAHFIESYLFRGQWPSTCLQTQDVNADGKVDIRDGLVILEYLFGEGPAPASPFPDPGTGASEPSEIPCESYSIEPPLEDPAARVSILEAVAPGGGDPYAKVRIAVSSSAPIAGFSGSLLLDAGVVGTVGKEGTWIGPFVESSDAFNAARLRGGKLSFGYLATLIRSTSIPPGESVQVLELTLCLQSGAPSGEYPLTLASAELIDFATGRAIAPEKIGGTLVVLERVADYAGCSPDGPACDAGGPVEPIQDLNAVFKIGDGAAVAGGEVSLPFSIYCDTPVQGYSFSVDFDEEILEVAGVDVLFEKPDRSAYGFLSIQRNDRSDIPGSGGVDEGFIVGAAVFSLEDNCNVMPAGRDVPALGFRFRVKPDAPVGSTEIRFLDGGKVPSPGQPVRNLLVTFGQTAVPEQVNSFVFVNGTLRVIPDITVFIRGDTNGDAAVDISDALVALRYLFEGSATPTCYDAADSNDDGLLNISDPICTLSYLFAGGPAPPEPFPEEGEDPTADSITCALPF